MTCAMYAQHSMGQYGMPGLNDGGLGSVSAIRMNDPGWYGYPQFPSQPPQQQQQPMFMDEFELDDNIGMDVDNFLNSISICSNQSPTISPNLSPSSQSSSGTTISRGQKSKEDKICGVCGDKALGFNFDAISCESCKAFFRRNAPKGLNYFRCSYEEKCKMDTTNRRFCKRCRLKKCFEIGMKKEYILSEEEKASKRQKIEENRIMKKMSTVPCNINNNSNGSNGSNESNKNLFLESSSPIPCDNGPALPLVEHPAMPRPLSLEDANAINELFTAYQNSLGVDASNSVSRTDEASFTDLVNIAELSVRRVIAMVKQVPSFKNLPQAEQIHLVKGASIDLLILRSILTFDFQKQQFLDPFDREETSAVKLEELKKAEIGTGLFDDYMSFVTSLAYDLHADETTLILLLVITLFSPDRENLEHRHLVSAQQEKYSMLLKSYLDSIYPPATSRLLFPKLLLKLSDIRNLNEGHSQILLKVNPEAIQPLMKEVLDLSC